MIRAETTSGVRVVTLARSEKRNALTPAMIDDLAAEAADESGDWSALLLVGEGPVFCAGFDLDLCREDPPDQPTMRRFLEALHGAILALRRQPRPVVLCAHGAAVAGGCALLGGADVVVADRAAKLGYPVSRLGVSPAISAPFLRLGAGDGNARSMLLDPGLFTGERAHIAGLVHILAESAEAARVTAMETAMSLAAKPRGAMAETKRWTNACAEALGAEAGLAASMSLVGGEEAVAMLSAAWRSKEKKP